MIECTLRESSTFSIHPWKNGLGKTTELAKDSQTPFRWRLSMAKLSVSGPFSDYPGYERLLVLLRGGPLFLEHSTGKSRHLNPLTCYKFQGEWNTTMELSQPGEDFNLFLLREKAKGNIYPTFIKEEEEMQFPLAGQEHFLYCIDGSVQIYERNTSKEFELKAHQLFQLSRESTKEYINLKTVGINSRSTLLWLVLHVKE